jgi:hypothetical protein
MRRGANVGAAVLAGALVLVAAAGLAFLSLLLSIGYCNEDIDLENAAGCEEDPTALFPLPIGVPAIVLGIALLIAHRGRRSAWLAFAAGAIPIIGVAVAWLVTLERLD